MLWIIQFKGRATNNEGLPAVLEWKNTPRNGVKELAVLQPADAASTESIRSTAPHFLQARPRLIESSRKLPYF